MACGSCGGNSQLTYSAPTFTEGKPKGSSKGVIKAAKNLVPKEERDKTLSSTQIPVVGEAGPTPKPLENADDK